jgi:hypothetical protein
MTIASLRAAPQNFLSAQHIRNAAGTVSVGRMDKAASQRFGLCQMHKKMRMEDTRSRSVSSVHSGTAR